MKKININEAKSQLSAYLRKVKRGERLVICRRNRPVAELVPLTEDRRPRAIGLAKGLFVVPEDILAPLPENVLDDFSTPLATPESSS